MTISANAFQLTPEKEFRVRTLQQSAEGLSHREAIEAVQEMIRQSAVKDQIIIGLMKVGI